MSAMTRSAAIAVAALLATTLAAKAGPFDPDGALKLDAPPSKSKTAKPAGPKPKLKRRAIVAEPKTAKPAPAPAKSAIVKPKIKPARKTARTAPRPPRFDPTPPPQPRFANRPPQAQSPYADRPAPQGPRYSVDRLKRDHRLRRRLHGFDLKSVIFAYDSTRIGDWRHPALQRAARRISRVLARRPYELFLIEGHTDAVGRADYNQVLSEDRARAVKRALVEYYGIPPQALETVGYGERFLRVQVDGPEPANRRVTIRRITQVVRPRWRRGRTYGYYDAPPPPRSHWFWDRRRYYPAPPPWLR